MGPLRRHRSHLVHRLLEREHTLLPHQLAQHPGKRAVQPWMRIPAPAIQRVGDQRRIRQTCHGLNILPCHAQHDDAHFTARPGNQLRHQVRRIPTAVHLRCPDKVFPLIPCVFRSLHRTDEDALPSDGGDHIVPAGMFAVKLLPQARSTLMPRKERRRVFRQRWRQQRQQCS